MFFSFVANEFCFKNALEIQEYIPSLPHILISSVTCDTVLHIAISSSFFFYKYMYTIHDCIMYIQSVPKKTLFYVFANISADTYSRETSRISTEMAWQEASNNMRLDSVTWFTRNWHFRWNFDPYWKDSTTLCPGFNFFKHKMTVLSFLLFKIYL